MKKDKKGFITEFKEFIMRGNVLDMAVGVIIATAFGKITTSLVNDVIMPAIGLLLGEIDLSQWNIVLKEAVGDTPAVQIGIGTFLVTIIDFLIIAFCIFNAIKMMAKLKKKKEEEPAAPAPEPAPSKEEVLLTEIRDLLKENAKK